MTAPAPKPRLGTLADLARLRGQRSLELIGGELIEKAAPSPGHGTAQLALGAQLFIPFNRRSGDDPPGGWWLMTEVEVYYDDQHVYRHDLVGWRRSTCPDRPTETPVGVRADWVCEILSPSNAGNDQVKKLHTLAAHQVPHYWIVDPEHRTLTVLRWTPDGYLTALTASADQTVRAEPFEAIALSVGMLFGEEPPA